MSDDAAVGFRTQLGWLARGGGEPYAGAGEPIAEYVFAPARRWRFDIAWPELMVAVEVDGGSWVGGRHSYGAGFERDCAKMNEAQLLGWLVMRVTPNMIKDGRALAAVERALKREVIR